MAEWKPKIRELPSGDSINIYSPNPASVNKALDWKQKNLDEWYRPPRFDSIHQKEEPDDTNAYNKGGMVKHGSSTRVSCKSKG